MDCSNVLLEPTLKNRKTVESESLYVEDRISRLPDGVICHILSFVPTEYCIRTSILSKRWEHLWAFSPNIELDLNLYGEAFPTKEELDRLKELCATFTHSVDNLFFLRDSLRVDSFKLHYKGDVFPPPTRPSSWLCAVIMCNVRELDLNLGHTIEDLGELPWCLFTCKTLVVLKLFGRFIVNVPYHVCLPNLKTLLLATIIYLDDASFQKFLSGCPGLEDLEIKIRYPDPVILNVGLSSLKRLSLISDRYLGYERLYDDGYKFVVDAPNLEFIHLTNWSDDILLKPLPNIFEAHVDIIAFDFTSDQVLILLQNMVNVTRLYLSEHALESLYYSIERALPTFYNLVRLELEYDSERGPVQLMNLLRSSPKLEVLSFPGGIGGDDSDIASEFLDHSPEQVPECLHHSLKIVEINGFQGEEVELNILTYLLENAMVLEKVIIFCWHQLTIVEFDELKAKLVDLVRLSSTCQLDLLFKG